MREAFLNSATDEEACLVAGISTSALYRYQDEHPEFREEKLLLKKDVNYKAKTNIVNSIKSGDVKDSQWWSERKARDEFSTKIEQEQSGNITVKWLDMNEEIEVTPQEVETPVPVEEPIIEDVVADEATAEAMEEVVEQVDETA